MDKLFYYVAFPAIILLCSLTDLKAQSPAGPQLALHITGLTSEERDALTRDLNGSGDARVAFACVPAGVIIIEPLDPERSTDSVRLRAMPMLLRNVAPARIAEDHLTQQQAEELCANARNN